MTKGVASGTDTFTAVGNYVGTGGTVWLDTVLESDGGNSDRLVIQDGSTTGTTGLATVKFGGAGALTPADGILFIEADNATTDPGAFQLASPVASGAYEFLLFRGGISDSTEESW